MEEKCCHQCHCEIEDDQHILLKLKFNKKMIQERHNRLVNKIGKELKIKNLIRKIQIDRTWRQGIELVKPDIAMVDEAGYCMIIEVTCPYKCNKVCLQQRKLEKERKYRSLITDELWQVGTSAGETIGVTICTLGIILDDSCRALKRIGNQCNSLQMIVMNSSVLILNQHFSTGNFCRKFRRNRNHNPI